MTSQTSSTPVDAESESAEPDRWSWPVRLGFRFCFVYFTLFCLGVPQIVMTLLDWRFSETSGYWATWLMGPLVAWTGTHLLGMRPAPHWIFTGGGDTRFDWVSLLCWLVIAVAATVLWSAVAGQRSPDARLHSWFRLVIRFALAGQMLMYGFAKAFPLQMPAPSAAQTMMPMGDFNRMGVLWVSMGASHPYEIAAGCAEILGGVLLLVPRTATLGALICAVDMTQVFVLNMTYDIPVKIVSSHLLLLSLFLLAPEVRRLFDVFLRARPVGPPASPPLFAGGRANRVAWAGQVALGAWLVGSVAWHMHDQLHSRDTLRTPLAGLWQVDEFAVDGSVLPAGDARRWQRLAIDGSAVRTELIYQLPNAAYDGFDGTLDPSRHTLALTSFQGARQPPLTFRQAGADALTLDGTLHGKPVRVRLHRLNLTDYPLFGPGFHWVHEGRVVQG